MPLPATCVIPRGIDCVPPGLHIGGLGTPDGAWGLHVPLLIGFGRASELIFTDPMMDAKRACEIGLVTEVVDDAELEAKTMEKAGRMARGPLAAYAIAKDNLKPDHARNAGVPT